MEKRKVVGLIHNLEYETADRKGMEAKRGYFQDMKRAFNKLEEEQRKYLFTKVSLKNRFGWLTFEYATPKGYEGLEEKYQEVRKNLERRKKSLTPEQREAVDYWTAVNKR